MSTNHTLQYSVLMSVYKRETAINLQMAMDSIWNQTKQTNDFVLVCDGPISDELNDVIHKAEQTHPNTLNVIRLKNNTGLGNALNTGIKHCKNDLIARMDSDDISRPYRCEKQLEQFQKKEDLCICSGIVEEFTNDPNIVYSLRIPPETHKDIKEFMKTRNPFNHPCVMYRKNAVEASGGYMDFYLLEDYFLWIRIIKKGFIGYNIQEPLLWMRGGKDLYKRRGGWKYARSQVNLLKYMKKVGIITMKEFLIGFMIRMTSCLSPSFIRQLFYKIFLRERVFLNRNATSS